MRLLLTGGAGFIGHHLIEGVLKDTDWELIVLDSLNYAGNLSRLYDLDIWKKEGHRVTFVWHDLRAAISKGRHKEIKQVDYIWHLAAESHVDRSLEDSIPFIESNVLGTGHLLEYIKKYQCFEIPEMKMESYLKKLIYFGTDEVFGPAPEGVYYKEKDTCNPSNPYSATKEGAEALCKAFAFSFGIPITITRTMNVFGERQHPEKFIPKTIRSISKGDPIILHGEKGKTSSRCWIHARKVSEALIFLTKEGEIIQKEYQRNPGYGIYHIVGDEYSVEELAEWVYRILEGRSPKYNELNFVPFHKTRPGHDFRYAMSGEKLKKLGFKSKESFDYSFNKMVNWMIRKDKKHWLEL